MGKNERIAKNTIFLYVRMVVVLFVSIYTTRCVLQQLGVVDYGIYGVVCGFVSIFSFITTSMSNAVQRFFNFEFGKGGKQSLEIVFNTALVIQLIIAISIFIIIETFGLWYINNIMVIPEERLQSANYVFQFSTVSILLVVMQVPFSAAIMAHEDMGYYAVVSVLDALIKLILVISLTFIHADKLVVYGLMTLTLSIINFLMYYIYSTKKYKELNVTFRLEYPLFREMLSFSSWNMLDTLTHTLKGQGVNVLLNYFFGPVVNAANNVASQIGDYLKSFSQNIITAMRPQLVQSYANNEYDRVKSMMFTMSKVSYMMLFVLALPIIIEVDYILKLWLGVDISEYTHSFVVIALVFSIISNLNPVLSQVVQATGNVKRYQLVASIIIGSILPISYIILKLGARPTSVYIVITVVTIINHVASMYILRDVFSYSIGEYVRQVIIPCMICSIIIPIIPYSITIFLHQSFIRLLLVSIAVILCSAVSTWYLMLNQVEKSFIFLIIKSNYR